MDVLVIWIARIAVFVALFYIEKIVVFFRLESVADWVV